MLLRSAGDGVAEQGVASGNNPCYGAFNGLGVWVMSEVLDYMWGSFLAGAGLVSCGYLFTLGALLAMRNFGIRAGFAYKLTGKPRSKSQEAVE